MKLIPFIIICSILFFSVVLARRKYYSISYIKVFPLSICVMAVGILGTYIMYSIENREWGGQSFFGAVLFFPILLFPLSLIFNMRLSKLLDCFTPAGFALLVPYKLNCFLVGCCKGIDIGGEKEIILFPSQIVEMIVAIFILAALLLLERRYREKNMMYPFCLLLYGSTRLPLSYLRLDQNAFLLGLPPGAFWSLVSIIIAVIWFASQYCLRRKSED